MSKKADKKKPPAKGKKGAAAPKGGAKNGAREVKLSGHPRAQRQIARAKGWGGLIGFGVAGYLTARTGAPFLDVALRALLWGVISYVVVWALAVQVWRHVAVAEVKAAEKRWLERKREMEEAHAEAVARARAEAEAAQAAARS